MVFFFSKKQPDEHVSFKPSPTQEDGPPIPGPSNESGFKSFRSRLQGYAKKLDTKDHDAGPTPTFSQSGSVAQTLSPPVATPIANRHLQLKLSSSSPALNTVRDTTRPSKSADSSPAPTSKRSTMFVAPEPDPRPSSSRSRALGTKSSSSSLAPSRQPTDAVTTTLAQRLNELAVANSEGLLNDDEYRLLRQDLFQRFASTSVVPTEAPVVPVSTSARSVRPDAPSAKRLSTDSKRFSIPTTPSNFVVDKPRTPSVNSRSSRTSGMASLFRRTGRQPSHDYSDSSSLFSTTSGMPTDHSTLLSRIGRKRSGSSLNTDRGDTASISSRRTNNASSPIDSVMPTPSIRSARRLPAPPSSFPTRLPGVESRFAGSGSESVTPSDETSSAESIRQQIFAVEAEVRRLMDAFNSLEITTVTQRRRTALTNPRDSVATLVPPSPDVLFSGRHTRKGSDFPDSDAGSIRSATSAGTSASVAMSSRRGTRSVKPVPSSSSRVSSLNYKSSMSSIGSSSRLGIGTAGGNLAPLGMSLPLGSSTSLRSMGHPMTVVHENETTLEVDLNGDREFGQEMEDLRRRREEVAARYEARLEYLRARLKGAELHEKLVKLGHGSARVA